MARAGYARNRAIDELSQTAAAARLDEKLNAMFAFKTSERRRRGTENAASPILIRLIQFFAKVERGRPGSIQIDPVDHQRCQRHKRRIRMILTMANLLFIKARIVLRAGVSQGVVIRMVGLNQHLSGPITSSRPTGNLGDQLKRSFRCAKVRQRQPCIHRNYADQCDVGEIVALGQHLRADEHIEFPFAEVKQRLLKHAAARGRVAVNAGDTQSRELFAQHLLELFRAFADIVDISPRAVRAFGWGTTPVVAIVTDYDALAAVIRQCHIAIWTLDGLSTGTTQNKA